MKRDFHFTMASSLLARLCLEHPEEALISISGEPIHGVAVGVPYGHGEQA